MMITGDLALIFTAFYAGLAIYIVFVEQPARLSLDHQALLGVWKIAYARGHVMGLSTVVVSALLGITAFFYTHNWLWIIGAAIIFANCPYTLTFIRPTNQKLLATLPEAANQQTRHLIQTWVRLHTARCIFGVTATILFLLAVNHYQL